MRAISSRASDARLGGVPYKGLQECIGTGGRQRIQAQLRGGGLTAPGVLILGAVVDQEQEPGRRQALDQAVEQGLGFGIDPVQILTHQQQRLHLAFAQQQALECLQDALAALQGLELQKGAIVWQGVQQREQGRDDLLEGLIQGEHLPDDLGPDGAYIVALLHVDIALEQVEHGEIRGGLAIGHRGTFEHPPSREVVGMDKLVHQAGLPHPSLSNYGDDVAVTRFCLCQRLLQRLELHLAPDKAGQPARRGGLEAPPDRAGPS